MLKRLLFFFCTLSLFSCVRTYDVIIVGGGASGTAAAIQAAREGADVLLVEEHVWLGGMLTSAGVSATDGCYQLRGGIWSEFRDSLEHRYGSPESLKTGWVSNVLFEPSVGADIFASIAGREKSLKVVYGAIADKLRKTRTGWELDLVPANHEYKSLEDITVLSSRAKVACRVLIDGTELGDIAKEAGVSYDLGMDARCVTGESNALEDANGIVQDITYVAILKDYHHPMPMEKPANYRPEEFRFCCSNGLCVNPPENLVIWSPDEMISYGRLPGDKFMINWPIYGNDIYKNMVDMTSEQRETAVNEAKQKTLRFLYFMHNELGFESLAIADDEFPTKDGLPFIPYYRESRRIQGHVQFTLEHIKHPYQQQTPLYRTAIAVGDYPVDQHHDAYNGDEVMPKLGLADCPIPSYSLPLGVMLPKEVDDLLVIEKSISVTNLVNGTTRLQPVVLQLGQAAGVVAALAVQDNLDLSDVSVRKVQAKLLDCGVILVPVLDLSADDPDFKMLQRVLLSGLMKYEGKNERWSNMSWFYKDRLVDYSEVIAALTGDYRNSLSDNSQLAEVDEVIEMLSSYEKEGKVMTRLECARLLDGCLHPFNREIDLQGNFMN